MRVTTAFNRLLALPGARVTDVSFTAEGVVVEVALRRRRAACSACGQVCRSVHDRSRRRWRRVDLAGQRLHVEYRVRRVRCPDCGVRVEAVPFARPQESDRRAEVGIAALKGATPTYANMRSRCSRRVVRGRPVKASTCSSVTRLP